MKKIVMFLNKNVGHGKARRLSISLCENDIIALMDSDDISYPTRFEKQLTFFDDETISVVGGQISEFNENPNNIYSYRNVEINHDDIVKDMKKRCPFNQMTVMFRKNDYLLSGGYLDWFCNEDYYLWARMYLNNLKFHNLPEVLVNVRANKSQVKRRRGKKYFISERKFQKYLLEKRIISKRTYCFNVFKRFVGEMIIGYLFPSLFIMIAHSKSNKFKNVFSNVQTTMRKYKKFSVAMCVYGGDNLCWFKESLYSIVNQTVKPDEIVLIVDGPINSEMESFILKEFEIVKYE